MFHEKAEHNLFDSYGENRRSKAVVCAACGQTYEFYKRLIDRFSRSCLEDAIKSYSLLYSDGPLNGWTNDILCKNCFDKVQIGCEDEIKQMHESESERVKKEAAHKAEEEFKRRSKEYKDAVSDKGFWRLMLIIFLIFAVPIGLSMCSGIGSSEKAPTELYYRQ